MDRTEKDRLVAELKEKLQGAQALYYTDFTGLNVKRMTELRRTLRKAKVEYVVIKNTLALRAVNESGLVGERLRGPTGLVVTKDPVAAAKIITDAEVKEAADYFASLKPRPWIKVVEADTVPKSFVGPGNKRLLHPDGGTEPLGNRIIEVPDDEEAVVYRDPIAGFVAYVPKGSIAKGEALVKTGGGKSAPCTMCHGLALKGLGDWPALAGRHPNYIVRQLWNMQNGERVGPSVEMMKPVVEKLTNDDMLAIAAYAASLTP